MIGRYLSHTRWFQRIMERRGKEIYRLAKRYGVLAMAVGALGPIMYSLCCWAGGALDIRWRDFWLVTSLRIPRVAIYLWAIQMGYVNVVS